MHNPCNDTKSAVTAKLICAFVFAYSSVHIVGFAAASLYS